MRNGRNLSTRVSERHPAVEVMDDLERALGIRRGTLVNIAVSKYLRRSLDPSLRLVDRAVRERLAKKWPKGGAA